MEFKMKELLNGLDDVTDSIDCMKKQIKAIEENQTKIKNNTKQNDKLDPKYLGIPNINFSFDLIDLTDDRNELWKQQRLDRGFDDGEIYNLGNTIVKFALPRFKRYVDICSFIKDECRIAMELKLIDVMEKYVDEYITTTHEEDNYLFDNFTYIIGCWL